VTRGFEASKLGSTSEQTEIFTIGHSNLAASDFIESLQARQIGELVDVRSAPYSQFASQFNREDLAHSLKKAGIDYVFAGETLGGRPSDPSCYKNGQLPAPKSDYLKLVDYSVVASKVWYLDGIDRLIEIARENQTVIMCSEEDPNRCHRHHLIAQTLLDQGVAVWHVRKGGECQAAEKIKTQASTESQLQQAALL
jgi:uncharacterized protein (DUF488 family)